MHKGNRGVNRLGLLRRSGRGKPRPYKEKAGAPRLI
jgi:hypothetical protein